MNLSRGVVAGFTAVVLSAMVAFAPGVPLARAEGRLAVGMEIAIGSGRCSLGFFAYDSRKNRLAVTSGHCADGYGAAVYNKWGNRIGEVVANMGENDSLRAIRGRGYTIIQIDRSWTILPFFRSTGSAEIGDPVTKSGLHGDTYGNITDTHYDNDSPWMSTIVGDVVVLSGDSGGPWYTSGRKLLGISASGHYERGGGDSKGSQAQPIWSLRTLIRDNAGDWGKGFEVWLED